jgi:hypothetical protein
MHYKLNGKQSMARKALVSDASIAQDINHMVTMHPSWHAAHKVPIAATNVMLNIITRSVKFQIQCLISSPRTLPTFAQPVPK